MTDIFIRAEINDRVFPVSILHRTVAGGNHRRCVTPDDDLSALPQEAQDQIRAHWSGMDMGEWERIKHPLEPAPTSADVAAETRRRVDRIAGTDERADMALEWQALRDKQAAGVVSDADKARARAIAKAWQVIKAIKAAGHALAAVAPIPADYASDTRWP